MRPAEASSVIGLKSSDGRDLNLACAKRERREGGWAIGRDRGSAAGLNYMHLDVDMPRQEQWVAHGKLYQEHLHSPREGLSGQYDTPFATATNRPP